MPFSAFSFTENPAVLARTAKSCIGIYGEKRFLNEIGDYSAAAELAIPSGAFGFLANYSGSSALHQSILAVAYGRSMGKKAELGLQFNYVNLAIRSPYGKAGTIFPKAGFIIALTDKFRSGFTVSNPFSGRLGPSKLQRLPSVYTGGLGYQPSEDFFIGANLVKEEDRDVCLITALQYRVIPMLLINGGVNSSTAVWWLGIGLIKDAIRIDITANYHRLLGIIPGILLQYQAKNK